MWLITALLATLILLILIVIMSTAMKLALMITTLYNYETKKLFIPATLAIVLWAVLLVGCFNSINNILDHNAIDILFSMIFDSAVIEGYKSVLIKTLVSTFIIGTLLQSFTYYAVNINYQRIGGTVRFSTKKLFKKVFSFIPKKESSKAKYTALSEVEMGPKKLTFIRAILTSIISVLITAFLCYGLFILGTMLSGKIASMF